MLLTNTLKRTHVALLIPPFILLICWFITNSKLFLASSEAFVLGLTLDMVLLGPILYLSLIWNTSTPKFTAIPVYLVCMAIASLILPLDQQSYLSWIKTWIIPLLEIGVISFIAFKVVLIKREYKIKSLTQPDFYSSLKRATTSVFPGRVGDILTAEIATIYYGFSSWKKRKLGDNEFTYHENSNGTPVLIALLLLIPVETFIFHILIQKWSTTAAWVLTIIGLYGGLQIFGILRSMAKRPVLLDEEHLLIRFGIFMETIIPYAAIDQVEITDRELRPTDQIKKISILGNLDSHNIIIHLKSEQVMEGLWGIKRNFKSIAFHVDDKDKFSSNLQGKMMDLPLS